MVVKVEMMLQRIISEMGLRAMTGRGANMGDNLTTVGYVAAAFDFRLRGVPLTPDIRVSQHKIS